MNQADSELRQGQMGLLLRWEGRLNNARVRELFGLSQVRASEWIREFRDSNPTWLEWNSKARSYYPTTSFRKHSSDGRGANVDHESSFSRYLVLTGLSHGTDRAPAGRLVWAAYPDLSVPDPSIFSVILTAARDRLVAEIAYRSMRHPVAHKRLISPHSIVRAGRRWHVRAFCNESSLFKDFSLGRIDSVNLLPHMAIEGDESEDRAWTEMVVLHLVAHPGLYPDQARLIELEYFGGKKILKLRCRKALVNYVIQDLRAATDVEAQLPPDFQLAVANAGAVTEWLFPT